MLQATLHRPPLPAAPQRPDAANDRCAAPEGTEAEGPAYEVRFFSLFHQGRALVFPCDAAGHVDLDALSERARNNYLYARATVGREHCAPCVCAVGAGAPSA